MPQYQVHVLRPDPPTIDRSFRFQARDDREALNTVRPAAGDVPLELWCGERIIRRFEA